MATLDVLRKRKAAQKRVRITLSITQEAFDALIKLSDIRPENHASQIASNALIFANRMGMYNDNYGMTRVANHFPVSDTEEIHPGAVIKVAAQEMSSMDMKSVWVTKYGGSVDGVNCTFAKYEVGADGTVFKGETSMPIRQMPATEEEVRRVILGPFLTLSHAEVEYEKSKEKGSELAPVRMLGAKRKKVDSLHEGDEDDV